MLITFQITQALMKGHSKIHRNKCWYCWQHIVGTLSKYCFYPMCHLYLYHGTLPVWISWKFPFKDAQLFICVSKCELPDVNVCLDHLWVIKCDSHFQPHWECSWSVCSELLTHAEARWSARSGCWRTEGASPHGNLSAVALHKQCHALHLTSTFAKVRRVFLQISSDLSYMSNITNHSYCCFYDQRFLDHQHASMFSQDICVKRKSKMKFP